MYIDFERLKKACEAPSYSFITKTREELRYCLNNLTTYIDQVDKDILNSFYSKTDNCYTISYQTIYDFLNKESND